MKKDAVPIEEIIEIFTDGACRGNPGPGGWGALLCFGQHEKTLKGGKLDTTSNQMELTAAIEALRAIKQKKNQIIVTTDSRYLKDGITNWIYNWQKNNWKTANKKPVKNKALWQALLLEIEKHPVQWRWVKAHSGDLKNERADQLANEGIDDLLLKQLTRKQ